MERRDLGRALWLTLSGFPAIHTLGLRGGEGKVRNKGEGEDRWQLKAKAMLAKWMSLGKCWEAN